MTAYIWDLDGTLLDSYALITAAAASAAADAGIYDTDEQVMRAVKQGSVTAYLKDVSRRCGKPYEDLQQRKETLERLRNAGAAHFVYTHRGISSEPILQRLEILQYFRETVTSVYGFAPKPSGEGIIYLLDKYRLDALRTWYVGDRTLDVFCAKDAGVKALLYLPEGSCVTETGMEDRVVRDLREI